MRLSLDVLDLADKPCIWTSAASRTDAMLTARSHCCTSRQAVLASHMGVVRLMDMMNEREAIRNEALLLLNRLTRDSVDIQKIAAFEGAFERLFSIIGCTAVPGPPGDLPFSTLRSGCWLYLPLPASDLRQTL